MKRIFSFILIFLAAQGALHAAWRLSVTGEGSYYIEGPGTDIDTEYAGGYYREPKSRIEGRIVESPEGKKEIFFIIYCSDGLGLPLIGWQGTWSMEAEDAYAEIDVEGEEWDIIHGRDALSLLSMLLENDSLHISFCGEETFSFSLSTRGFRKSLLALLYEECRDRVEMQEVLSSVATLEELVLGSDLDLELRAKMKESIRYEAIYENSRRNEVMMELRYSALAHSIAFQEGFSYQQFPVMDLGFAVMNYFGRWGVVFDTGTVIVPENGESLKIDASLGWGIREKIAKGWDFYFSMLGLFEWTNAQYRTKYPAISTGSYVSYGLRTMLGVRWNFNDGMYLAAGASDQLLFPGHYVKSVTSETIAPWSNTAELTFALGWKMD